LSKAREKDSYLDLDENVTRTTAKLESFREISLKEGRQTGQTQWSRKKPHGCGGKPEKPTKFGTLSAYAYRKGWGGVEDSKF